MTLGTWIAILIFVGTAAVSLSIAYLHRKQMRQDELFRIDPTVGLTPPLNPISRFLKRHWWSLVLVSGGIYYFVRWMIEENRNSFHAGVSAALAFWFLTNFLFVQTQQFSWRRSDLAFDSTSLLSRILAILVHDLHSTGQISDNAKQKIDSIVSEARDALKKQK